MKTFRRYIHSNLGHTFAEVIIAVGLISTTTLGIVHLAQQTSGNTAYEMDEARLNSFINQLTNHLNFADSCHPTLNGDNFVLNISASASGSGGMANSGVAEGGQSISSLNIAGLGLPGNTLSPPMDIPHLNIRVERVFIANARRYVQDPDNNIARFIGDVYIQARKMRQTFGGQLPLLYITTIILTTDNSGPLGGGPLQSCRGLGGDREVADVCRGLGCVPDETDPDNVTCTCPQQDIFCDDNRSFLLEINADSVPVCHMVRNFNCANPPEPNPPNYLMTSIYPVICEPVTTEIRVVATPAPTITPPPCVATTLQWGSCQANAPATPDGVNVNLTDSTEPDTGTATFNCSSGVWNPISGDCSTTPTDCPATIKNWTVGGVDCTGALSATPNGALGTAVDDAPSPTGQAEFRCTNGVWAAAPELGATCAASGCAPGEIRSWGGGCSGPAVNAAASGSTGLFNNTAPGYTGSANFTCNSGTWSATPQAGATCSSSTYYMCHTATASCAPFGCPSSCGVGIDPGACVPVANPSDCAVGEVCNDIGGGIEAVTVTKLVTCPGDPECSGICSDRRLKRNIIHIGVENGFNIYEFQYREGTGLNASRRYIGVMAQEVLEVRPDAVVIGPNGIMAVNYDLIGVKFREKHE